MQPLLLAPATAGPRVAAAGSATMPSSSFLRCVIIRIGWRRTGRCCTRSWPPALRPLDHRQASGRTSPSGSTTPAARATAPAGLRLSLRRVLQREHHLEERRVAQVALGLQLLDQLLERHVLMRVRAERRLAHPPQQLAEGRVARRRSVRSTSVLTKKPISALRLARGCGRRSACPTTMSSCPV